MIMNNFNNGLKFIKIIFFTLAIFGFESNNLYGHAEKHKDSPLIEFLQVSFSTNPVAINNTITICLGQSITYRDTSTSVGINPTYLWDFQGGNKQSDVGFGPHIITYNTVGNFTTTLTVNGSSTSIDVVVVNASPVNPILTVTPNVGWAKTTFNNSEYFNYCSDGSAGGLFLFSTNSLNTNVNTQHVIDWGDNSLVTSVTGVNIIDDFHAYQSNGIYEITYTVKLDSGCSYSTVYNVFIGANPTASIINNGVPVLCNPGSVQYLILPGPQNTMGTIYTFQVNDGSPPFSFTHEQAISPGFFVTHNFNSISCGTNSDLNGTLYPNSFQASITASNPCGSSSSAIGPINIQSKPIAAISSNPSNSQICLNSSVIFTDTTLPGTNIGSSPLFSCTEIYKKYWEIKGPSGTITGSPSGIVSVNPFVTVVGNLGFNGGFSNNPSIWTATASKTLDITFKIPGVYTITIYTSGLNNCGITSESKTICVNPQVISDFTINPTMNCAPETVKISNLSTLPGCSNTNVYNWQVTSSNPDNCPMASAPGWSFTSGNASAFEPEITFTSPGIYNVQLTTSLINSVDGSLCQADIKTRSVVIKAKPSTTLVPQTICEGTTITLNTEVLNCYATQSATYLWDFGNTPPTSISSTTASSPTATFNVTGTYNYTLTLTNECGSNTFSNSIKVDPAVQISASGPAATCLNSSIILDGSISGGTTIGNWTASVAGGSFTPNDSTLSPTYTPPVDFAGTIVFTLTSADPIGSCPSKSSFFPVEFNSQATANAGTYAPVCLNESLQLNAVVGGAASSGIWTSSNGGTFSDPNSLVSTFLPPNGFTGTLLLTLTTNDPPGPCEAVTDTVTITVLPTPTINTVNDVVICDNEFVGPITFSGINATNYNWTNNNIGIGLAASGTGNISFTSRNAGTSPISGTITVVPFNTNSGTSCPGAPITFTITINPKAQANAISSQVVCNGDMVTIPAFSTLNTGGTTTYSWSSSNTAIGLAASGTGDIVSFLATNVGSAPISTIVTIIPTFSNSSVHCIDMSKTFKITVNPTAKVTQPSNQIFCAGASSTVPAFSTGNTGGITSYNWTNDNSSIGIGTSGTGNIPSFIPINNTGIPITATITVTPTFSNESFICTGASKTFTITVNPKAQVNSVPNIVVCNGDIIPTITFSAINTIGTTNYFWANDQSSLSIGASGFGDIPSFTAINMGTGPIVATITVNPIYSNTINCNGVPITFTITINPSAEVNTIANKIVCNNGIQDAILFSTSNTGGTTTYSWTNDSPSIGLSMSGIGNIASFSTINTGANPITAAITVTPTYTNDGVSCSGPSKTFSIIVNPSGQVNAISNQMLCNGANANSINFSTNNSGGTTSFSWTNSNTDIGLPASGNGNINSFSVTNSTASPITAIITVIPSFKNGTLVCSGPEESFTITVNPSPTVSFSIANETICSGESSSLVTLSSATIGASLSWTAVQPAGITGVSTSGSETIPIQTLVNSTNAPITINYTAMASINDGSACLGSTYNYAITIEPIPSIRESFTESICSEELFTVVPSNSVLNSIPVGTTYSWIAPVVTGGLKGGESAEKQNFISGIFVNPTNTLQTATYTVTPSFNGCSGTPFTVVINVNPKPFILDVVYPAICSETAFTVIPSNSVATIVPRGTTYTWTTSTNININGQSASSSAGVTAISQTLTNSSNTIQTILYTVTPTSGDTGNCVGLPFTISVSVIPKPFVKNSAPIICSETAFSVIPTNGIGSIVPTGTTYTWSTPVSNPLGAIKGGIAQPTAVSAIGQNLINTTTDTATLEYEVIPTMGACTGNPFIISVTVNPLPTTLGLKNQTYCNDILTNEMVFTNEVRGTTYTWTNSNTTIGLPASGTGNIPVFLPKNIGTTPITATIFVVATANGCARPAESFTITVNPSPAVSFSLANETICSGERSSLVTLSSATIGAMFSWSAVQPFGITGVSTSGLETIPAQKLVNSTNKPITVTYEAVALTNDALACIGGTYYYTITIEPRSKIENKSIIICSEQSFTVSPMNGNPNIGTIVPVSTTYTWTISNNTNIIGASNGTGNQISQTLINTSATIQTITYTVIPSSENCQGTPFTVTVEVYPKPDAVFDSENQIICNNTSTKAVTISSTRPGAITFAWTANIPVGISGAIASGTNTIPSQTLINTTDKPLTITYTAAATFTNSGSFCSGKNELYSITVNPTFLGSVILSNYSGYNVSVFGENDGTIDLTVTGGSGIYTFNWTGPNGFISSNEDLTGLSAGRYSVAISDGYCEPIFLTFLLTQPTELLVQQDSALTINLMCFGNTDGAVGIQITQESVGPYNYTLLNGSNAIIQAITHSTNLNPQFTGLVAGIYSVLITDINGGKKTVSGLTIIQPNDLIIKPIIAEITCYGANNGSITLNVAGGTAPYRANWSNLATGLYQNNLSPGSYTITITDTNGCTKSITIIIQEAPIFSINPVVTNISCFGANDGSINLNLIGGKRPLSLIWSDGITSGTVRNNLSAGTYSVTISDGTPCYINSTFHIVEPQPLVLSAIVQNALNCTNPNSGSINLVVSGGTPPFTYSWSNSATTEDLSKIPNGNYSVVVTDARGCAKTASYAIFRPEPISISVENVINVDCDKNVVDQASIATVSGGVPPYQIVWSSGTVSGPNNQMMNTATNGTVLVTATDSQGCFDNYSFVVSLPKAGTFTSEVSSYSFSTYGIYSIVDPIQFSSVISGDYTSVVWDFGDGTVSNEVNPIHVYNTVGDYIVTQTVTYSFGCVFLKQIFLKVEKGYVLEVPNAFTPNNDNINDLFKPICRGLKTIRFDIYDTWGGLIYSEEGETISGWNGKINNFQSENGNYTFKVYATTFYNRFVEIVAPFVLIK